jgi:cell wall-associated NlpC family hydrolase
MRSEYLKLAIQYAWQILSWRTPYLWGGNDEYVGLDCSGLIVAIFRRIGMIKSTADHSSQELYNIYSKYLTESPTPGCLVFYGKDLRNISHVALMISSKHIIEAAGAGRDCTTVERAQELGARVRLNPYQYRTPLAVVDPFRSVAAG